MGREESFAALLKAWDAAKGGHPQRVHISARPGFGKTRLLKDLAARLKATRAKVVTVGGSLGTREIAFAAAGDLAAALASLPGRSGVAPESAATLVELNPAISTWYDQPARRATHEDPMRGRTAAVRELIAAVAFENPVAILIDDLHWWDDASITLLGAVLGTLGDAKVLIVTAARPEANSLALLSGTTLDVPLDALSQAQVEELVVSIATLPNAPWVQPYLQGLWRASRGSPLLVIGMLQLLEERKLLARVSGEWSSDRTDVLEAELLQGDVLRARLVDLDRGDLWLLTLVAVGRTNLDLGVLAAATGRSAEELTGRLTTLESRGLVIRDGSDWRTAHDEIADEVLRVAPPDATPRATAQLGTALFRALPFSENVSRRAAQLLRVSGDPSTRADLFRTFAAHRFDRGDRRSLASLASDLLGADARSAEVQGLVRGAPLSWRLGLVSSSRKLGAALAVLTTSATLLFSWASRAPAPPPPEAVLAFAYADSTGRVSWVQAEVRPEGWVPGRPIPTTAWPRSESVELISENAFGAAYSPVTGMLVTQRAVEGPGVIDLFFSTRDGRTRQLHSARDDGAPALSPDGRLVAFTTARWDSMFHYDVALMGVDDSIPEPLTSGPASDGGPVWSSDGSILVFARHNWGDGPNQLCAVMLGDRTTECRDQPARESADPVGWVDGDRVLVSRFARGFRRLEVLQWSTNEKVIAYEGDYTHLTLSPDGQWVACVCVNSAGHSPEHSIFPLSAPALIRPVAPGKGRVVATVWLASGASQLVANVRIDSLPSVRANVPAQLSATLSHAQLRPLTLHGSIRWSVVPPAAARIDSLTGELVANGTTPLVTVHAVAGARARDSMRLSVDTSAARHALAESWTNFDDWVTFGLPAPGIGRHADGTPVLLNNGDGSFYSGVIGRQGFDARRGLAVEARVSTPITRPQWQVLSLGLTDVAHVDDFERRRGENAPPKLPGPEVCYLGYAQEGRLSGLEPLVSLLTPSAWVRVPNRGLFSGAWHTILVQILPDGRCGFAIDGEPVAILRGSLRTPATARVFLRGNSYNTRIAVGPLSVWEGVRTDIDWAKAPVFK